MVPGTSAHEGLRAQDDPEREEVVAWALAAGVRGPWVTAAAGYGSDPGWRPWLEEQRQPCVVAVRRHERRWISTGARLRPRTAAEVATALPPRPWQRLSAGQGAKGPRLDAGARQPLVGPVGPGWGRWLRVRRSLSPPTELADSVVCGPVDTCVAEMVRVAGTRWAMEESVETAKGEVGLDHEEVRRWTGG
jgi:SRSO17 transposase